VKILGIDPGYDLLGWSVIDDSLKVYDFGVIKTSKSEPEEIRLLAIHKGLISIIERFQPNCLSIEKLFFQKNSKTAITVSKTIGVAMVVAALNNMPVFEYSPTQIKNSITGFGRADKSQVEFMIKRILKIPSSKQPDDAFDALAIALCHALNRKP
jgi:crossover junction endodeoxyribonuclease RuvC